MAVLARLLGIPSRVAYGFTSGTGTGSTDQWLVTTHDAHAWPELYFQGYGWLRFEPTPPRARTARAPRTRRPTPTFAGHQRTRQRHRIRRRPRRRPRPTGEQGRSADNLSPNLRRRARGRRPGSRAPARANGARTPGVSPWEVFGLVVAGLVVLGLAAPWTARLVIRRRRWRLRRRRGGPAVTPVTAASAAVRRRGRRMGARGVASNSATTSRTTAPAAGRASHRARWRPGRAPNWPWPSRPGPRSAASPWPRSAPGTPRGPPTAPGCGRTA